MSTSTNIDAASALPVKFRNPRAGSCISAQMLEELSSYIYVEAPDVSQNGSVCTSKDPNNLASIDGEGCVLVPAATMHQDSKSWVVATGADVEFTMPSGFDATQCFRHYEAVFGSSETGTSVDAGAAHIWPTLVLKSVTADKITLGIKNATQDATIYIQVLKIPAAPQQA